MKKEIFSLKNILVLLGIIVVILAMVFLIILDPFKKEDTNKKNNSEENNKVEVIVINSKEDLIEALQDQSKKYYEEEYYPRVTKEDLEKHTEFGIQISLESIDLSMIFPDIIKTNIEKYECNLKESKVHIYPESPYEKDNYRIEYSFICNK